MKRPRDYGQLGVILAAFVLLFAAAVLIVLVKSVYYPFPSTFAQTAALAVVFIYIYQSAAYATQQEGANS